MYYILNQNGQIVAVDPELLSQLAIDNVDELYKKLSLEEVGIELNEDKVRLTQNNQIRTFTATKHPLTGILGELTLVAIDIDSVTSSESSASEDELFGFSEEKELLVNETQAAPDNEALLLDDELFGLKDDTEETDESLSVGKGEEISVADNTIENELFDLVIPSNANNAIATIDDELKHTAENETTPIYIDVETISQKIGISTEDYNLFLDEYIDTALTLEEALQSNNKEEQADALHKLSHLSNVLHLPYVEEILKQIDTASEDERHTHISSFFSTLARLTTARFEEEKPAIEKTEQKEIKEEIAAKTTGRKPIDLSDVKPIHFDFQLEEAAKDLSLPVELIEEFVNDFIVQAHEETEKMLTAYEEGDLETIQKIGHLLKGTSSNLRITPLSDTLYEIQFNDDINKVPDLVRNGDTSSHLKIKLNSYQNKKGNRT